MFGIGGFIAKLGLKALFGNIGSKAASAGKAGLDWLGRRTPLEIIGVVALVIVAWQHFVTIPRAHHALASCTSARAKDAQALKDYATALGVSQSNEKLLRGQIADSNARVNALATKSASEQQSFEKAQKTATQRAQAAQAVAQRLAAQSRQKPAPAASCGHSEPLGRSWP